MNKKFRAFYIALLLCACLAGMAMGESMEVVIDEPLTSATAEPTAAPTAEATAAPTAEATATPTAEPTPTPAPTAIAPAPQVTQVTAEELPWYLTLVNSTHAVPEGWTNEFVELRNNQKVDARIYPELQAMFDAARAEGVTPIVLTSYRTYEDQKQMLINKYNKYINKGYSHEDAQAEALKWAAYPGYSEHQLGLAVDIDSSNTSTCSNETVWNWMLEHCAEYGFILRYPSNKTEITGISHEQWHFRYVGVEAATYIMQNDLCLEEYLQMFYGIT